MVVPGKGPSICLYADTLTARKPFVSHSSAVSAVEDCDVAQGLLTFDIDLQSVASQGEGRPSCKNSLNGSTMRASTDRCYSYQIIYHNLPGTLLHL